MRLLVKGAWTAAALLVSLTSGGAGHAQPVNSSSPIEVELYNSALATPRFGLPRLGRRATVSAPAASMPSFVTVPPSRPTRESDVQWPDAGGSRPHMLLHFFLSGIACLVRGDPAGAAEVFAVTDEVASDLPAMHYMLALARLLADFNARAQALPLIERSIAAEPDNPLYTIAAVFADANLSTLKSDGALYFTPAGTRLIRDAANRLPAMKEAYNGKYFTMLLGALEATGDPAWPQRLNGFAAMLGQGRAISLPSINEPQSLGRLLVLTITDTQLMRYEARFLGASPEGREASVVPGAEQRRTDLASRRSYLVP